MHVACASAISPKRIHHQRRLLGASFKTAAASMCICLSHPKGSSSNSCCWEVHSRLLLQVCASAYLTQKDPAAAVAGSFIQNFCCKYVHLPISPKRIQQQLLLGASFKTAERMCISLPSHPKGSCICWSFTEDCCYKECASAHLNQRGFSS